MLQNRLPDQWDQLYILDFCCIMMSQEQHVRAEQLVIDGHLPDPGWKASRLWTDSYLRSVAVRTASHCALQHSLS